LLQAIIIYDDITVYKHKMPIFFTWTGKLMKIIDAKLKNKLTPPVGFKTLYII